jgi:pimeloyl-ACP methyl ester carboxylesterase
MRSRRLLGWTILGFILIAAAVYLAINPEKETLDDKALANASGKFVRLSTGITHYELSGPNDARTVVLFSGATVPYYLWDSTQVALTANGLRVLRYDYYGRGYSDRPALRYDLAMYNQQVAELLDTLGVRGPVDVAGVSMGGAIAVSFADAHPERVRTVTLVDPAIGLTRETPLPLGVPVVGNYALTLGASSMATGQLDDFLHPEHFPDWVSRYRVQMRYKGFRRSILETQRGDVFKRPPTSFTTLARSPIPILILWGKADRTVPFSNSTAVRSAFPRAEFHAIDGAGHLPQIEQAATVDSILVRFLRVH